MPYSPYARTLGQIIAETQKLCGDFVATSSDGRMWTWAEVRDAVNVAVLNAVIDTGVLRASADISMLAGSDAYILPDDCLRLLRVGGVEVGNPAFAPTTIHRMDAVGEARMGIGAPSRFYRDLLRPEQIGVTPVPDEDGTIVQIHYVRSPVSMTSPTDYPDIGLPEWMHGYIRYGAAIDLLRYRRDRLSRIKLVRFSRKWADALGLIMKFGGFAGSTMAKQATYPCDEASPVSIIGPASITTSGSYQYSGTGGIAPYDWMVAPGETTASIDGSGMLNVPAGCPDGQATITLTDACGQDELVVNIALYDPDVLVVDGPTYIPNSGYVGSYTISGGRGPYTCVAFNGDILTEVNGNQITITFNSCVRMSNPYLYNNIRLIFEDACGNQATIEPWMSCSAE